MKVAVIHYWLVAMRGGERVLERILAMYPDADLFTHVYDPDVLTPIIRNRTIKTTFISKLPGARVHYQKYLSLMPLALEELDLNDYDLVISCEAGPAKGVIPRPDSTHVCYCHSPMRYIWDQYHTYKGAAGRAARFMMPTMSHLLRQWDVASSARVDSFAANSEFIAARIEKYYRRDATVVHPPVDVEAFSAAATTDLDDAFVWIGQLVPYKRPDLAVEAFNRLGLPLVVVGKGGEKKRLQAMAGPNIKFVDSLSFKDLCNLCARSRGLIFTSKEDFGITPVEVMAAGRPVLAFGEGGALETMAENVTGLFYYEQTPEALVAAVEDLIRWMPHFEPAAAQAHARRFSPEMFDANFKTFVLEAQSRQRAPGRPLRPDATPLALAPGTED
ncbi:MAG: glycosyltransferase [Caulobacteraceae bacterium]|nr:glycosyltransferase [Caulobacteraceae bacterium]